MYNLVDFFLENIKMVEKRMDKWYESIKIRFSTVEERIGKEEQYRYEMEKNVAELEFRLASLNVRLDRITNDMNGLREMICAKLVKEE